MKQDTKEGYCKFCKRVTKWIHHADFTYYVCTIPGCNNRSENPGKEKPLITNKKHYFTYV